MVLHGEKGRCVRVKYGEHQRNYQSGLPRSNLFDHVLKKHDRDRKTEFRFDVVGALKNDVLAR